MKSLTPQTIRRQRQRLACAAVFFGCVTLGLVIVGLAVWLFG